MSWLWAFPAAWLVCLALMMYGAANRERKAYNGGSCSRCRLTWRRFDTDSQGGRGYVCDTCKRGMWVSYDGID